MWSAVTCRRFPNHAATSRITPQHLRVVARMEPLAAQSGITRPKPGLRRKRLHPGYNIEI